MHVHLYQFVYALTLFMALVAFVLIALGPWGIAKDISRDKDRIDKRIEQDWFD